MLGEVFVRLTPLRVSSRAYLLGLIAAVLVPLLAFSLFLLIRHQTTERDRLAREAEQTARQIAIVVDGELEGLLGLLRGLAASAALVNDNLAQFHANASRLVGGRDEVVVLRELGTRQFVNTQRPFGTTLPPAVSLSPGDRDRLLAGQPVISDVYISPTSGEPRIAAALPIRRAGGEPYVLAITVPTSHIRDALMPAVPPEWIVGIGDRQGTYVTRSARHEDITGKPGIAEYLARAKGRSGTFSSSSFEGAPLLAGYYRSDFSGWLFAANIAQATVEEPLRRSLATLAALGSVALFLSALLAYLFGRQFTAAPRQLVARADALGGGREVAPISTRLTDFAVVGGALASAAAAIAQRTSERERKELQLRLLVNELNHRVKNTLANVQSIASQTLRGAISLDDARSKLVHRLMAVASVHDVLTQESWEGADLKDLLLGAIRTHGSNRFSISGPPVRLTPQLALSFGFALHELATNAAQYGALSAEQGSVSVSWQVDDVAGAPWLRLRWVERNGPRVQPPARQGFGLRLIERSLSGEPDARVALDFAPEGLTCAMETPVRPGTPPAAPTKDGGSKRAASNS